MDEHRSQPYAPPMPPPPAPFTATVGPIADRGWLRDLATRQRMAIVAGIGNALGGILAFSHVLPGGIEVLFELIVAAFIIVAAYRLGQHLHGVGIGIVAGIAMLIPLVWIVVLVVLTSQASKRLRAAGVHVGIFGAGPDSI